MTSRNAPCPCGSGKKYKLCHLRSDEAAKPRIIPPPQKPIHNGPGLAILIPSRGSITIETAGALGANLDGFAHAMLSVARKPVIEARNQLVKTAKLLKERQPFIPSAGWNCLWVDSDAYWPPGSIARLMGTLQSADLVAGWFCGRQPNANPVAYYEDGSWPKDFEIGDIMEVHRVGFHFVLHKAELLDRLPVDPFTPSEDLNGAGEDIAFCDRVREAGGKIVVDTGCPIAHIDDDGGAYIPGYPRMKLDAGKLIYDNKPEREYAA